MAIMCPDTPCKNSPSSGEEKMFHALEQSLSDEYLVFHSLKLLDIEAGFQECEADFTIFHPQKGILVIEAKNGKVSYSNGRWYYGNGMEMSHEGPFQQAAANKRRLRQLVMQKYGQRGKELANRCKFGHAVWFPAVNASELDVRNLPQEADPRITLTLDSFDDLEAEIAAIMDLPKIITGQTDGQPWSIEVTTRLGKRDVDLLLHHILAPEFKVVSIADATKKHQKMVFKNMLDEQSRLLNYLEEQSYAVINGRAGTGKTVMAVEKARRHALSDEKVLFLTYNKRLCDHLKFSYSDLEGVDFYNIDALVVKICGPQAAGKSFDYNGLYEYILDECVEGRFSWQHVIVDEGQDFGREGLSDILAFFKDYIHEENSTLKSYYIFYDRNQMVQGTSLPEFIQEADCRLTLYRNCRNTNQIASTAEVFLQKGVKARKIWHGKMSPETVDGEHPKMFIVHGKDRTKAAVDQLLAESLDDGFADGIQILTCGALQKSDLYSYLTDGEVPYYPYEGRLIPITTCRKFKGLEKDVIILIDLDMEIFDVKAGNSWDDSLTPYVGASRARHRLGVVADFSDGDCCEMLEEEGIKVGKNPKRSMVKKIFYADYQELT